MPITRIVQGDYGRDDEHVAVVAGPPTNLAALQLEYLATVEGRYYSLTVLTFVDWLATRPGFTLVEMDTYNVSGTERSGLAGEQEIADQWGEFPMAHNQRPCPRGKNEYHQLTRYRLAGGALVWRCDFCPYEIPAPVAEEPIPVT